MIFKIPHYEMIINDETNFNISLNFNLYFNSLKLKTFLFMIFMKFMNFDFILFIIFNFNHQ